jgi:hypothetical protein
MEAFIMETITGYVVTKHDSDIGVETMLGISMSMQTALENLEDYIEDSPLASAFLFHRNVFPDDTRYRLMFVQADKPGRYILFEIKKKTIIIGD